MCDVERTHTACMPAHPWMACRSNSMVQILTRMACSQILRFTRTAARTPARHQRPAVPRGRAGMPIAQLGLRRGLLEPRPRRMPITSILPFIVLTRGGSATVSCQPANLAIQMLTSPCKIGGWSRPRHCAAMQSAVLTAHHFISAGRAYQGLLPSQITRCSCSCCKVSPLQKQALAKCSGAPWRDSIARITS